MSRQGVNGYHGNLPRGEFIVHLKPVDDPDPSIEFVREGDHLHLYLEAPHVSVVAAELKRKGVPLVRDAHDTDWNTRECILNDPDGHMLYLGQRR